MKCKKWEHYISEYGKDIYSFCIFLTKNRQEADDLYQDTFLRAMEKDAIKEEHNPKSYLISIAVNLWNNKKRKILWRKQKADIIYDTENIECLQLADENELIESQILRKQSVLEIRGAVRTLPDKMRIVVLMYYMQEMTIDEIGKILRLPSGTVKSRLHNARVILRKKMEEINYAG